MGLPNVSWLLSKNTSPPRGVFLCLLSFRQLAQKRCEFHYNRQCFYMLALLKYSCKQNSHERKDDRDELRTIKSRCTATTSLHWL